MTRFAAVAVLAVVAAGCTTRDVYLVLRGSTDATEAVAVPEAGPVPPPPLLDASMTWLEGGAGDGAVPPCAVERYQPELEPLGIYILVDESTSMTFSWGPVVQALESFLGGGVGLAKVSAGLQYFPPMPPVPIPTGWGATVCEPTPYQTPDVPVAPLAGNLAALRASLGAHGPLPLAQALQTQGGLGFLLDDSPMHVALQGAIDGARAWARDHASSGAQAVVLLVTDGVPGILTSPTCNATLDGTMAAATGGVQGSPSVATYVLGVGSQLGDLDRIAQAGGTGTAHLVQSSTAEDILAQIESVRSAALPCDLPLDASWLSRGRVNLELVEPAATTHLYRVSSAAACTPVSSAGLEWYPSGAARAVLCPTTCLSVRSRAGASLEVVYGCLTAVAR